MLEGHLTDVLTADQLGRALVDSHVQLEDLLPDRAIGIRGQRSLLVQGLYDVVFLIGCAIGSFNEWRGS